MFEFNRGKHGGLMVSALDSEARDPGSSLGWRHFVDSSNSNSLYPGHCGGEFNARNNPKID